MLCAGAICCCAPASLPRHVQRLFAALRLFYSQVTRLLAALQCRQGLLWAWPWAHLLTLEPLGGWLLEVRSSARHVLGWCGAGWCCAMHCLLLSHWVRQRWAVGLPAGPAACGCAPPGAAAKGAGRGGGSMSPRRQSLWPITDPAAQHLPHCQGTGNEQQCRPCPLALPRLTSTSAACRLKCCRRSRSLAKRADGVGPPCPDATVPVAACLVCGTAASAAASSACRHRREQ